MYVLRNGDLASSSKEISIWRINHNDYLLVHTLKEHTSYVNKLIELVDGAIASSSDDTTIKIWDNYKCIHTLKGHTSDVNSIIEMNDCIISVSADKTLRIWDESTYQCIQTIQHVSCLSRNGLLKLNDNTVIVGGRSIIYVIDIKTYKVNHFKDQSLGKIYCLNVYLNELILLGNDNGEIICYDPSFNRIISKQKFHSKGISCLIKTEDNHFISASYDLAINVYE